MKSITFRADDKLIESARVRAKKQKKTLNGVFNEWLRRYADSREENFDVDLFLKRVNYVKVKGKITRDMANER